MYVHCRYNRFSGSILTTLLSALPIGEASYAICIHHTVVYRCVKPFINTGINVYASESTRVVIYYYSFLVKKKKKHFVECVVFVSARKRGEIT